VRLGASAALVDGKIVDGDVTIEDGAVAAVGVSPAGAGGIAVPGFVDVHVNGFAGVDFMHTDVDGYRRAAEAMAATGVVAFQPTLVSAPRDAYAEPLGVAAAALGAVDGLPEATGVHLEGPFLSPAWPGAHDPANLLDPDPAVADWLLGLGPIATVTVAPELAGAAELIDSLLARGIVVSCGHSDADAACGHAAFDRGAHAITHIHNAHRRWAPRDPGIGGVALVRPDVTVQAIVDGVHLAPESAYAALLAAGPRFCLVTDAIEAATLDEGEYRLGVRTVHVRDGAARLEDGTLAGSVATIDQGVRNLLGYGACLEDALHAATATPAALIGREDLGVLRPGAPASLTVLDEDLQVGRTLVRGREAFARG
jgi:N-acetylglucosamine-6-phosphate deacetylase